LGRQPALKPKARWGRTFWTLMEEDNVKKPMIYTLIALSVIVLTAAIIVLLNPLRRSQEHIKNDILKITPMGTSMEDVIKIIENKRQWEIDYISYDHGYRKPGTPAHSDIDLGRETIVGEKSMRVLIGEYRNIFTTSVTVFWGFDKNSKLIEIYVWKDKDGL